MLNTSRSEWKLAWIVGLALMSGGVFAYADVAGPPQAAPAFPPAPPTEPQPPNGPEAVPDRHDEDIQAQLEVAQRQLEKAARQVAELSTRIHEPYIRQYSKFDALFGRVIIGVQLDPASEKGGARVVEVSPGGPAAEAGVRVGDVIISVNGKDVTGGDSSRKAVKIIHDVELDSKVVVRALRDGVPRTFSITPRPGPASEAFTGPFPSVPPLPPMMPALMMDGPLSNMELASLSPRLGKYFGTDKGVLVVRAPSGDLLKLEDGDVILSIDGREPTSGSHATRILGSYQAGEKVTLHVMRDHKTVDLHGTT